MCRNHPILSLKGILSGASIKKKITQLPSLLPPRFLLLVELRALPCPSILLLPTQPPITVPAPHTQERDHQSTSTHFFPFLFCFVLLNADVMERVNGDVKRCALDEERHHRGIMTAQHSLFLWGQTSCDVYVTCTASWLGDTRLHPTPPLPSSPHSRRNIHVCSLRHFMGSVFNSNHAHPMGFLIHRAVPFINSILPAFDINLIILPTGNPVCQIMHSPAVRLPHPNLLLSEVSGGSRSVDRLRGGCESAGWRTQTGSCVSVQGWRAGDRFGPCRASGKSQQLLLYKKHCNQYPLPPRVIMDGAHKHMPSALI